MPLVEMRKVAKSFGDTATSTCVLRDVTLEVARGEFVAIVGFSGSGKTTLLSLLAGLVAPDQGTIVVDGKEVVGPGRDRGVVFQNYSLLPWLTAFENIHLAVEQTFPNLSRHEKKDHVRRYLEMVRLISAANKKPSELSGGMRQRVALARALAMDPAILLLDEPLSALDALTRASLQDEIDRIWRESGKTVVFITNDVDEALYLADRVIPLLAGPAATLGPEVRMDLPRPRQKKHLCQDPGFREAKREILSVLIASKAQNGRRPKRVEEILPAVNSARELAKSMS